MICQRMVFCMGKLYKKLIWNYGNIFSVHKTMSVIYVSPDETNDLYKKMVQLLTETRDVYGLAAHLEETNAFDQQCYIGEPYDGTIFKIPISLWNEKTGMNVTFDETKYYADEVPVLSDLLDNYSGSIWIMTEETNVNERKHYVSIMGSA